jgi:hypothetical protein
MPGSITNVPLDADPTTALNAPPLLGEVVRGTLWLYAPVNSTMPSANIDDEPEIPPSQPICDRCGVWYNSIK